MSRGRDISGFPRDMQVAQVAIHGRAGFEPARRGRDTRVTTIAAMPILRWPDLTDELCGVDLPRGTPDPRGFPFAVFLLGPIRVFSSGGRVVGEWRSKPLELLAYLAVHPLGAAKDQILEALWPDGDPQRTQQHLWHTVSFLRSRLLGPAVQSRIVHKIDDLYRLDFDNIWADVVAFQEAAKIPAGRLKEPAALQLACHLYKGDFCQGRYYSWATATIERLRTSAISAASQLSRQLEEVGDPVAALRALDQALRIDPYDEELCRRAMTLEAERGRHDQVVRRFRRLRRLLIDDLDIEPSPLTVATTSRFTLESDSKIQRSVPVNFDPKRGT